jgi:hypothetical protein
MTDMPFDKPMAEFTFGVTNASAPITRYCQKKVFSSAAE